MGLTPSKRRKTSNNLRLHEICSKFDGYSSVLVAKYFGHDVDA